MHRQHGKQEVTDIMLKGENKKYRKYRNNKTSGRMSYLIGEEVNRLAEWL